MTDITSALKKIQIEEVKFGQPISEYTTTKIGASLNYVVDNYEPLTTILAASLSQVDGVAKSESYSFLVPFKCNIKGMGALVNGKFGNFSGGGSASVTISSSISTGNYVASVTVPAGGSSSLSQNFSDTIHGKYSNFTSTGDFDGEFEASAGSTITINISNSIINVVPNGTICNVFLFLQRVV